MREGVWHEHHHTIASFMLTCFRCCLLVWRGEEAAGWGLPLVFPLLHLLEYSTVGKPLRVLLGRYLGVGVAGLWEGQEWEWQGGERGKEWEWQGVGGMGWWEEQGVGGVDKGWGRVGKCEGGMALGGNVQIV